MNLKWFICEKKDFDKYLFLIQKKLDKSERIETIVNSIDEFVNSILNYAVNIKASDIHFESHEKFSLIRIRIDGVLNNYKKISNLDMKRILSKIKILSKMEITKTIYPQEGRFQFLNYDLRVSCIPCIFGEKIVIRILGYKFEKFSLDSLGFNNLDLKKIKKILKKTKGMILIAGPTGSGKTTTLYSMINFINNKDINILTIEDPVEYKLEGVNQVNINLKVELGFEEALKRFLRQDPDVILLGEIRDEESARMAMRSSITGHMVLSTIHTDDSFEAIARLIDMNIEKYILKSAITLIIAQRLVKIICKNCLGFGCKICNFSGFNGRKAIYEVLDMEDLNIDLSEDFDVKKAREEFELKDFKNLKKSFEDLINQKITTKEEGERLGIF